MGTTNSKGYLFTSESVSRGHPDKIADQISDRLLDEILAIDPHARVALETFVKTGLIMVGGELSTQAFVNVDDIAREVVADIGYNHSDKGFDAVTCAVMTAIGSQSTDIAQGVDRGDLSMQGAGDQGMMFGYACQETEALMPAPIFYAHQLVKQHEVVRKSGQFDWVYPDAKAQLTFRYDGNHHPVAIDTIVFSTQHAADASNQDIEDMVRKHIIEPVIPAKWLTNDTRFLINPTGRFVIGGPMGDTGLTGRKIIVDTYGGASRHGGGCFSGKDPSKVDRSGAYMARFIAKSIVGSKLAERCEVQLAYAIGYHQPVSIHIETFGTGVVSEDLLVKQVRQSMDLSPWGIVDTLRLLDVKYYPLAAYGHMGRNDLSSPWEQGVDLSVDFANIG